MAIDLEAARPLSDPAKALLKDYLATLERRIERDAGERRAENNGPVSSAEVLTVATRLAPLPPAEPDLFDTMDVSEGARLAIQEHLDRIRQSILLEARAISSTRSTPDRSIGPLDILGAAARYAPGTRIATTTSFSQRLAANVSMITLLSLFAAIVFGMLGLWPVGAQPVDNPNGYLDIAKVFAGVVVGSAGAASTRGGDSTRS
jgi:hypothetical protein